MRLPVRGDCADQPAGCDQLGAGVVIVAWVAQTFLQLVLLSIIMVGQSVQSAASDARAAKEFADTETILDRLDVNTAGGIRDVLDAIHAIGKPAGAWQTRPTPPRESNWPGKCGLPGRPALTRDQGSTHHAGVAGGPAVTC